MSILYYDHLDSSTDAAKRLIKTGITVPTSIIARQQDKGRGQHGRHWHSEPGGLFYSFIYPYPFPFTQIESLQLKIAQVVVDAIQIHTGILCRIKKPNDVYFEDQKCAGILLESSSQGCEEAAQHAIIGIGLNINQASFPNTLEQTATSLKLIANRDFDMDPFIQTFHKELPYVF